MSRSSETQPDADRLRDAEARVNELEETIEAHAAQCDAGQAQITALYAERNAVVLAFARLAQLLGWPVGTLTDPEEPDWPVLVIETPQGQVSWHMRAEELPHDLPEHPEAWDGHTTPEKYQRLGALWA